MNRIRKGDHVIVTAGKSKGQKGEVLSVQGDRVVVQNANLVKRHTKPNPQANQPGGIVEREASIHISNVMPFNPASGKGERVSIKVLPKKEGERKAKRIRLFSSTKEAIDA
ncbi:MAG: 50S ribosomal protein L24 [Lysobacteraceae bacterium]